MTEAATALKPATIVPEARRTAFLPALFSPALMLIGERAVYQASRHESDESVRLLRT